MHFHDNAHCGAESVWFHWLKVSSALFILRNNEAGRLLIRLPAKIAMPGKLFYCTRCDLAISLAEDCKHCVTPGRCPRWSRDRRCPFPRWVLLAAWLQIHFRLCKHCLETVAVTGAVSALDNLLEELGTWGKDIKEDGDMDTTDKKGGLEDQLDDLTEKLKAALETGEPMLESLGACFKCGEEIKEKSILVGKKVFCEGCFVCDSCHTRYRGDKVDENIKF